VEYLSIDEKVELGTNKSKVIFDMLEVCVGFFESTECVKPYTKNSNKKYTVKFEFLAVLDGLIISVIENDETSKKSNVVEIVSLKMMERNNKDIDDLTLLNKMKEVVTKFMPEAQKFVYSKLMEYTMSKKEYTVIELIDK